MWYKEYKVQRSIQERSHTLRRSSSLTLLFLATAPLAATAAIEPTRTAMTETSYDLSMANDSVEPQSWVDTVPNWDDAVPWPGNEHLCAVKYYWTTEKGRTTSFRAEAECPAE